MLRLPQKLLDILWIIVLLVAMILPTLGILIQPDRQRFADVERRNPASIKGAIGPGFQNKFSRWLEDRFLFRFELLKILNRANYILNTSAQPSLAVVGEGDWLFLGDYYDVGMSKFRGIESASNLPLTYTETIRSTAMHAKKAGIPFVSFFVPDKQRVYNELLPSWIREGKSPTRIQRTVTQLTEDGVQALDLTPVIKLSKRRFLPYFLYGETDSHWNFLGAFVASEAIHERLMDCLKINEGEPFPIRIESLRTKHTVGDISRFLQLDLLTTKIVPEFSPVASPVYQTYQGQTLELPFATEIIGTTEPLITNNIKAPVNKRILFLRDSFGEALSPIVCQLYSECIFLHYQAVFTRKSHSIQELIKQYHPDAVVLLMVERVL